MVYLSGATCLLGGILGLFLLAPGLSGRTPARMCTPLRTLNETLSHRRRFMKHYFPINYTIRVHHREIFKLKNIHRMRSQVEGLEDFVLQSFWFQVSQSVLKKVLLVLPERHPSHPYTLELKKRFEDVEHIFIQSHTGVESEVEETETIDNIFGYSETPENVSSWRFASPKSLLDNFYRTMLCLFSDCFASQEGQDYCAVSYWRKGRKKEEQPES